MLIGQSETLKQAYYKENMEKEKDGDECDKKIRMLEVIDKDIENSNDQLRRYEEFRGWY